MKRKRVCLKYHKAKNDNRLCEHCRAGAKIDTAKEMDYVFIEYQEMLEDKRMFYKSQISMVDCKMKMDT